MSIVEKKGKGGTCNKAIRGTPTERAGMPCKGRSIGKRKKIKESKERGGSMCGQAIRGVARMKKEFSDKVEEESKGVLW